MIEYFDNKLGKVKVLNVTEARANFANVLRDAGSQYLITKNNKPLRVIIDYSELERIKSYPQEGVENRGLESRVEQSNNANEAHVAFEVSTNEVEQEKIKKEIPSAVKGVIAANVSLAKQKEPLRPVKKKDHKSPQEILDKLFVAQTATQQQTEEAFDLATEQKRDDGVVVTEENDEGVVPQPDEEGFMLSAAEEVVLAEEVMPGEDYFLSENDDSEISESRVAENKNEGGFSDDWDIVIDETSEELVAGEKEEAAEITIDVPVQSREDPVLAEKEQVVIMPSAKPKNTERTVAEESRKTREEEAWTPEQKEYFEKYKKLYASFLEPAPGKQMTEQEEDEKQVEELSYSIEENVVAEKYQETGMATQEAEEAAVGDNEVVCEEEALSDAPSDTEERSSNNGLPSLKDLLQELDAEQLSDEEGGEAKKENSDRELDDLINRIKHNEY
ncbi:MAG: hypothetical protein ACD_62C00164G0003 [uncultured bacterium]|nr:MAG: hypothetical protein ACD_62C00164G0003 [uncultured bacterium]